MIKGRFVSYSPNNMKEIYWMRNRNGNRHDDEEEKDTIKSNSTMENVTQLILSLKLLLILDQTFSPWLIIHRFFLPFHIACRQNMKKRQRSRCVQHFYFEGSDNNRNWTLFMAIVVWQKQAVQRAAFCSFSLVGIYLATCVHLHEKIIFFLIYTVILAKRKKIGNQTKLHRLLRPLHLCI